MKITYIYSLSYPEGNVRYIGKSDKPKSRLRMHIYEAKRNKWNSHKNNWIRQLLEEGKEPIIDIVEEVDYEKWEDSEIYWISQFKAWNFDLVNKLPGGVGIKFHTEETRLKMKEASKTKSKDYITDEWKKKIGLIHKGNTYCLGKKLSEEHKKKIGEKSKGNKYCLGNKNNLGTKWNEESRKKASESRKGKVSKKKDKSKFNKELIKKLRSENMTIEKISKIIGCSRWTVGDLLKK